MKSKPIVRGNFRTIHTSFVIELHFFNNIIILTGKTTFFSFIKECMLFNPALLCINYLDNQRDVLERCIRNYKISQRKICLNW